MLVETISASHEIRTRRPDIDEDSIRDNATIERGRFQCLSIDGENRHNAPRVGVMLGLR
jgi:hypothetical protein